MDAMRRLWISIATVIVLFLGCGEDQPSDGTGSSVGSESGDPAVCAGYPYAPECLSSGSICESEERCCKCYDNPGCSPIWFCAWADNNPAECPDQEPAPSDSCTYVGSCAYGCPDDVPLVLFCNGESWEQQVFMPECHAN